MQTLITKRESKDISFENFIKKTILYMTKGKKDIKRINFLVDENSKKNVFIHSGDEINIEMINKHEYLFKIFPIPVNKNFNLKFGCELETCIKFDNINNKDIISKFILLLNNKNSKELELLYWKEIIKTFVVSNLIDRNDLDTEFIRLFPVSFIALNPKSGYTDFIIDMKTGVCEKAIEPINYHSLIFTRDSSVICGDSGKEFIKLFKKSMNQEELIKFKGSIHCEIISPILTEMQSLHQIKILYEKLFNKLHFDVNKSMGFHVNVSIVNDNGDYIYFSDGMIDSLLNFYESYEKINYYNYRDNNDKYAKSIKEYTENFLIKDITPYLDFTNKNLGIIKDNNNKKYDYFKDNFLEGEKFYRSFINLDYKYLAIHTKEDYILEFRLFPPSDKTKDLYKYISDSFKLINDATINYIDNHKSIIQELQELNLKVNINYNSLTNYIGPLWYYDSSEEKYYDIKVFFELESSLISFFEKRDEYIEKIIDLGNNKFIIEISYKNIITDDANLKDYYEKEILLRRYYKVSINKNIYNISYILNEKKILNV